MSRSAHVHPTAVVDAGARIGGWRSVEAHADNVVLYAHDRLDPDDREDLGWQVTLHLSGIRFPEVDVTEYRIDRDHGMRAEYDALPKRGSDGVYLPAELTDLMAADAVVASGPATRHVAVNGALDLTVFVQGQGITFLEISEVDALCLVRDHIVGAPAGARRGPAFAFALRACRWSTSVRA